MDYNPLLAGVKQIYVFKFIKISNRNEVVVGISIVIYELYNKASDTLGLNNRFVKNSNSKYFGYEYIDYRFYNENLDIWIDPSNDKTRMPYKEKLESLGESL